MRRMQAAPRTGKWTGQADTLPADLATKFRAETKVNPAFKATMEAFSDRQRTRTALTLRTLLATVRNAGTEVEREDIARVLKLLAANGVGELVADRDGRVDGLRDIKYSLWALADTCLGKQETPRLMSTDSFTASQFVRPAETPRQTHTEGPSLNASREASRVPATPLSFASQRAAVEQRVEAKAAKAASSAGQAHVTITIGGEPLEFTVDLRTAIGLIRQLD